MRRRASNSPMMRKIAFVLLLIAFACKKQETVAALEAPMRPPSPAPMQKDVAKGRAASFEGPDLAAAPVLSDASAPPRPQAMPRMVIRNAQVSMVVADTASTVEKITAAVDAGGGYVSDSKVWRDGELLRATLVLKLPANKLSPTIAAIRRLGVRVENETISSQEVTQEYVDLESQLRNQEAAENELRQLMTDVRQKTKHASEVLEMYEQLTTVEAQVEQTKGRLRYLSTQTAMATLNVELVPDAIAKPVVQPGWQPVVVMKDASRSLVNALQAIADAAIWILIYVVPMVALFLAAALIGWRVLRAIMRRNAQLQS